MYKIGAGEDYIESDLSNQEFFALAVELNRL